MQMHSALGEQTFVPCYLGWPIAVEIPESGEVPDGFHIVAVDRTVPYLQEQVLEVPELRFAVVFESGRKSDFVLYLGLR